MTVALINRVNLGSGRYPLAGWVNIDVYADADIQRDFRDCTFEDLDEVNMSHVLEHISWRETNDVLRHVHGWLRPGGKLTVEVPDIDQILALGTKHPLWFKYVYGDQSHEGEYHRAGFTRQSLINALVEAHFEVVSVQQFISEHPGRETMPCLLGMAYA